MTYNLWEGPLPASFVGLGCQIWKLFIPFCEKVSTRIKSLCFPRVFVSQTRWLFNSFTHDDSPRIMHKPLLLWTSVMEGMLLFYFCWVMSGKSCICLCQLSGSSIHLLGRKLVLKWSIYFYFASNGYDAMRWMCHQMTVKVESSDWNSDTWSRSRSLKLCDVSTWKTSVRVCLNDNNQPPAASECSFFISSSWEHVLVHFILVSIQSQHLVDVSTV